MPFLLCHGNDEPHFLQNAVEKYFVWAGSNNVAMPAARPFDLGLAGTCARLPVEGVPCMVCDRKDHKFI